MNENNKKLTEKEALAICDEIFMKCQKKLFLGIQCRTCREIALKKNNIKLRCLYNAEDFKGCNLINNYLNEK